MGRWMFVQVHTFGMEIWRTKFLNRLSTSSSTCQILLLWRILQRKLGYFSLFPTSSLEFSFLVPVKLLYCLSSVYLCPKFCHFCILPFTLSLHSIFISFKNIPLFSFNETLKETETKYFCVFLNLSFLTVCIVRHCNQRPNKNLLGGTSPSDLKKDTYERAKIFWGKIIMWLYPTRYYNVL